MEDYTAVAGAHGGRCRKWVFLWAGRSFAMRRMLSALAVAALFTGAVRGADFNIAESRKSVVYVRATVPGYSV